MHLFCTYRQCTYAYRMSPYSFTIYYRTIHNTVTTKMRKKNINNSLLVFTIYKTHFGDMHVSKCKFQCDISNQCLRNNTSLGRNINSQLSLLHTCFHTGMICYFMLDIEYSLTTGSSGSMLRNNVLVFREVCSQCVIFQINVIKPSSGS